MSNCPIPGEDKPNENQKKRIKKLVESLPDDNQFEQYSGKLKALSDATRLKILYLLSDGELCVCEIIYALDKPQSSISHHLNILKNLGFIKGRKEGIWIHYSLSNPEITDIVKKLIESI
ncbi:metalloregulator ArsR/SmtB family transcription factor [uncultured Methanobacterium sp.]|uniref:ArsR/SmtB family transcription factor n=1 Tax=uncultured Methanobacterium sp. TaxID=176306 RepID=UPI002AA6AB73|nr:metalloregulator ArsR/SmtB family transcription factor [uncultured Methanobacterium sp.]